jgi:transposase
MPMISSIVNLPDSIQDLKEIIAEREQQYQTYIKLLEEKIRLLQDKIFGRRSEKFNDSKYQQLALFNEAEDTSDKDPSAEDDEPDTIIVPAHSRKKRGRKPLPDHLPRVTVEHDLSEEEKVCGCGAKLDRIGDEVSEKLDIIPAKVQVIRHIRYKYACKKCEGIESEDGAVKIAPCPAQIIPKGIASEGLAAHIVVSKFADALPFYRQEGIMARLGVEIPRATMANWAMHIGGECGPLLDLMHQDSLRGPVVNIDETPLQVLGEPGRPNTSKSYMWAFRGGLIDRPVLIFQYHPTRSGEVARKFLEKYHGYVQTDGYSGYDDFDRQPGIIHVGCWSHGRRNFTDVIKAMPGGKKAAKKKEGVATTALSYIGQLYEIERQAKEKGLQPDEIYQLRQERSKPILEKLKKWFEEKYPHTPPKGLLGKAISYCLNRWKSLERYLEDGRLKIDNNLIENAIRPFALGRKNWLFSGNPRGAKASAALYSLIETAKANGLDPYWYLRFLFERLPLARTEQDYRALLPHLVGREHLRQFTAIINAQFSNVPSSQIA